MDLSVVIPVTFWNISEPIFRISSLCISPNHKTIVTGSYNGQLCLWNLNVNSCKITPKIILIGHKDTVTCVVCTNEYVISSCEGRLICKWNLEDGYCSRKNTTLYVHRKMKLRVISNHNEEYLFTCGDYSEIFAVHPFTLQVMFVFHSTSQHMWISSFEIIKTKDKEFISGITTNGCVKVWVLGNSMTDLQRETQVQLLPITNVVDFRYNLALTEVLIVSNECCMLFDSDSFKCISKFEYYNEEKPLYGNFYNDNIIIGTNTGKFYLYSSKENEPKLKSFLDDIPCKVSIFDPVFDLSVCDSEKYFFRGDCEGRVCFYKSTSGNNNTLSTVMSTIKESWVTNENAIFSNFVTDSIVTCCIYVFEIDKFFLGCFDGSIISVTSSEAVMSFYFPSAFNKPVTETFYGHNGKINCMLYPYEKYSYYNKSHLVSGGSDFCVCLWDIFNRELLYKFCFQGGEILRLIIPPEDCTWPVKLSICSVSSDHSVALLNLKDRRCLILTSSYEFSVVTVHWKPLDDFIIVEYFDGTIFVWQIETGHLDRVLSGVMAQEVIYACNSSESFIPDYNFYIHEQNNKKHSLKPFLFNLKESTNSNAFRLNGFLTNELCESQIFLCDLANILEKFCPNFESESLITLLDTNTHMLTKALNHGSPKKSLSIFEKIIQEADIFQGKLLNSKNNNFTDSYENNIVCEVKECIPASEIIQNLIKFFVSVLHYWGENPVLDEFFCSKLGVPKPEKIICLGICSQPGFYSLCLPSAQVCVRKSSGLFSSACVAIIALTKILLSNSGDNETDCNESMYKKLFSSYELISSDVTSGLPKPKIEVFAKAWQCKSLPLRKLVHKLYSNYLQSLDGEEITELLEFWYKYLPHFRSLDKTLPEKVDFENLELKTVALTLFGVVGADLKFKFSESASQENFVYQTCSSFVYLLLLPISQKRRLGVLQEIAIDFVGRGYIVWEQFLKIEKVIPLLFTMCSNLSQRGLGLVSSTNSSDKYLSACNSLKSIAVARTTAFINCLKTEVNQIKLGQNHSFLTESSKSEVLSILTFLLEKTPYIMLLYLNDVISLIIYCVDISHLRTENISVLIPVIQKFRQIHHSVSSQRIAVGLATGIIAVHDLKTGKVHEIPSHKDSVSALKFSDDGKFLASYSCYENKLLFWQILTGIFGLGQVSVKCVKSLETYRIHDEEIRNHLEIATLSWVDKKSVLLTLCDGTEDVFSLC